MKKPMISKRFDDVLVQLGILGYNSFIESVDGQPSGEVKADSVIKLQHTLLGPGMRPITEVRGRDIQWIAGQINPVGPFGNHA